MPPKGGEAMTRHSKLSRPGLFCPDGRGMESRLSAGRLGLGNQSSYPTERRVHDEFKQIAH